MEDTMLVIKLKAIESERVRVNSDIQRLRERLERLEMEEGILKFGHIEIGSRHKIDDQLYMVTGHWSKGVRGVLCNKRTGKVKSAKQFDLVVNCD